MEEIKNKHAWKARYLATSEALEKIRAMEIAALTEAEALRQMFSLVTAGTPWRETETWSGLVEQQALFHRRRKQ